jgi:hypothetical protein
MIASSFESINLHGKQIESIQVNSVAQVPLQAIWLWRQRKMAYSFLDQADRDDISSSDAKKRLTTVASIAEDCIRG